jgi:AcrR family transcriptional regulator
MRTLSTPARARKDTAARILAAARQILDREGVAAVAMRPVADRVGITPMAVYRHYTNRASLLNVIADEGFHTLAVRMEAVRFHDKLESQLMQLGDVVLDFALEFPNLYDLMFLARREGARLYPRDFKADRSPTFRPSVRLLEEAMRTGELRPDDPVEIAFEISALSHGLIVLYLGGRLDLSAKKFRLLFQRSFRRYLRGLHP